MRRISLPSPPTPPHPTPPPQLFLLPIFNPHGKTSFLAPYFLCFKEKKSQVYLIEASVLYIKAILTSGRMVTLM